MWEQDDKVEYTGKRSDLVCFLAKAALVGLWLLLMWASWHQRNTLADHPSPDQAYVEGAGPEGAYHQ